MNKSQQSDRLYISRKNTHQLLPRSIGRAQSTHLLSSLSPTSLPQPQSTNWNNNRSIRSNAPFPDQPGAVTGRDMGGKDDELDEKSLARVRLVAQRKRQLEDNAESVREHIRSSFGRLREALLSRERQLLRQVDAISRQRVSLVQLQSSVEESCPRQAFEEASLLADLDVETELIERILDFGRVSLSNGVQVSDSEPYAPEEYLEAGEDLVSFDKSLKSEADELDVSSVLRRRSASVRNSFASAILSSSFVAAGVDCGIAELGCEKYQLSDFGEKDESSLGADANVTTSEQCNDTPANLKIKRNLENTQHEINEETSDFSSPVADKPVTVKEEAISIEIEKNDESEQPETTVHDKNSASKSAENCTTTLAPQKVKDTETEHPIQIQQWLQQILAETETEPIIHEIGQFSTIPNTRLYREFPVET